MSICSDFFKSKFGRQIIETAVQIVYEAPKAKQKESLRNIPLLYFKLNPEKLMFSSVLKTMSILFLVDPNAGGGLEPQYPSLFPRTGNDVVSPS